MQLCRLNCRSLLLLLSLTSIAHCDDPSDQTAPAESKLLAAADAMSELRVILKGADGEPVVGAAVRPYAMRMVEIQGHGFWDEKQFGPPKDHFSDTAGVAVIRYPAGIEFGPVSLTTKLVTFVVRHSDYVQEVVDFELGPDLDRPATEAEVELKKGCELRLWAVNDNGASLPDFGVVMAGPYAPEFWATTDDGGRRTSAVNDGTWQTMMVATQADGLTLFSGLLPLRVRPSQAVSLRNVRLSPGTIVRGRLSDNVPRPVLNGRIISTTAPKPDGDSWSDQSPSLVWHEWTTIAPDGTFVLSSIPRSGQVQIIAVCDDFVSETTIPAAGPFVMGQLFDVDAPEFSVTVSMEPTATVELTIHKPDGSPLDSGTVSSSPNMRYFKGGSTLLGQTINSIELIRKQLMPPEQWKPTFRRASDLPFLQRPVVDGVATLRGIPIGAIGGSSAVLHDADVQFPSAKGNDQGQVGLELTAGQTTQQTVTAVPHEPPRK